MTKKKQEQATCQFVVERNDKGEVRRCGEVVPKHELPTDPFWPPMCRAHLRAYTAPVTPSERGVY